MEPRNRESAESLDIVSDVQRRLREIVPEAFSEGRLDIDRLRRSLGEPAFTAEPERYALTWPGKSDAYRVLQTPSTATLRPIRERSVNFDAAKHLFIEGENLEVLKVLQKSYFSQCSLIYIDPPYNTGSDRFIYPDRFQETREEYLRRVNELSDDGTLMREGFFQKNNKENGRFHSNWLSMMLPRLYIARNLLRANGIILVSIDDNEAANLKLLLDEIFGPENFVAQLVWEKGRKNDAKLFSVGHEYMLVYARSLVTLRSEKTVWREPKPGAKEIIEKWRALKDAHGETNYAEQQAALRDWYASLPAAHPSKKLSRYKWVDKNGPWRDRDISWPGGGGPRYDVLHPETKRPCAVPEAGWRFSTPEEMQRQVAMGLVQFREDHTEPPFRKAHLLPVAEELEQENVAVDLDGDESQDEEAGLQVMGSVIYKQSQVAVKYLRNLLGGQLFDNPKDHEVLARLIAYCTGGDNSGIILDFFAGSASTAEAVLTLNQRDGGTRQVVCVQLPELVEGNTPAAKAGHKTIADVSRERMRRVILRIQEEAALTDPEGVADLGFRSFLLAPSGFKQWRGDAIEEPDILQKQIEMFGTSEKSGASQEDLLYELLLKAGRKPIAAVEALEIQGVPVFGIEARSVLFLLSAFSIEMIEPLLAMDPKEIVALDSVFKDSDQLKSNLDLQCRDAGIRFTCV